jgi:hypothetical protein
MVGEITRRLRALTENGEGDVVFLFVEGRRKEIELGWNGVDARAVMLNDDR